MIGGPSVSPRAHCEDTQKSLGMRASNGPLLVDHTLDTRPARMHQHGMTQQEMKSSAGRRHGQQRFCTVFSKSMTKVFGVVWLNP
jgi:hypothetical protein